MRWLFVFVAIVAGAIVLACEDDSPTCYAGEYTGCPCPNSGWGYAMCGPKNDYATSLCVCDGTTPGIDAGKPALAADAAVDAEAGAD